MLLMQGKYNYAYNENENLIISVILLKHKIVILISK